MIHERYLDMEAWKFQDDHEVRFVWCLVPDALAPGSANAIREIVQSANQQVRRIIGEHLEQNS